MRLLVKASILILAGTVIGGSPAKAQTAGRYSRTEFAQRYKRANNAMPKVQDALAKKDYARAKREAAAILAIVPEHSAANFMMAKIAYVEKDYTTALGFMEKAKSTYSLMSDVLYEVDRQRMSQLNQRRNDLTGTINDLLRRLETAAPSQQGQIRGQIAEAEHIRDDIDKELNDAHLRTDEASPPAGYFFFHGNILLRLNRNPDAEQQYTEALRLNPAYGDAANNLASLHFSARQYEKALNVLTDVEMNGATVNPELKAAILRALGR